MKNVLKISLLALVALHYEALAVGDLPADVSESWLSKTVRRLLHGETPAPETAVPDSSGDVDRRRIDAAAANGCEDRNKYCNYWAKNGECDINPKFMLVYCNASCGACGGNSWSTTEGTQTVNRDEDIKERVVVNEKTNEQWANAGTGAGIVGTTGIGALGPQVGWTTEHGERLTEAERETLAREQRNTKSKTNFGGVTGTIPAGVFVGTGLTGAALPVRNRWSNTEGTQTVNRDEDINEREVVKEMTNQQWANAGLWAGIVGTTGIGAPVGLRTEHGERLTESERETLAREHRNTQSKTDFGGVEGTPPAGSFGLAGAAVPVRNGNFAVTTGTETRDRQENIEERIREQERQREQWMAGGGVRLGAVGGTMVNGGAIWVDANGMWFKANGERITKAERETIAREQRNTQSKTHFGGVTSGTEFASGNPGGHFLGTPLVAGALNGFPIARPAGTNHAVTTGTKTVQKDLDIREAERVKEMLMEQWAQGRVNGLNGIGATTSHGTRTTEREREMNAHTKEQTQSKTDFVNVSGFGRRLDAPWGLRNGQAKFAAKPLQKKN